MVKKLGKELHKRYGEVKPAHFKFKSVILDAYSTRYLCKLCQPAVGYLQHPNSEFLKNLSHALNILPIRLKLLVGDHKQLYMVSRISASKKSKDQVLTTYSEHSDEQYNLKELKKNSPSVIFQRDNTQMLNLIRQSMCSSQKREEKPFKAIFPDSLDALNPEFNESYIISDDDMSDNSSVAQELLEAKLFEKNEKLDVKDK